MTPVALFELVLVLLGAALALAAGRLGLPPAAALVSGGMALAMLPRLPAFDLDPDLIMVLFLPPLLLESATGAMRHPILVEQYRRRVRAAARLRDERDAIEGERGEHFSAALVAVRAKRATLAGLHRERRIHGSVLRSLEDELDLEEMHLMQLAGHAFGHGAR